jgi:hypothetical protein
VQECNRGKIENPTAGRKTSAAAPPAARTEEAGAARGPIAAKNEIWLTHVVIRSLVVPHVGSDVAIRRSSRRFKPCSLRSTFCDLCHTIPGEVRF